MLQYVELSRRASPAGQASPTVATCAASSVCRSQARHVFMSSSKSTLPNFPKALCLGFFPRHRIAISRRVSSDGCSWSNSRPLYFVSTARATSWTNWSSASNPSLCAIELSGLVPVRPDSSLCLVRIIILSRNRIHASTRMSWLRAGCRWQRADQAGSISSRSNLKIGYPRD